MCLCFASFNGTLRGLHLFTQYLIDPATVFAGLPVSIAATYLRAITSVQFIKDPAVIGWKKEGWGVWYAPGRPDGFLSTLFAIDGNRPYLLYAEQECVWQITGCVALEPVRWKND